MKQTRALLALLLLALPLSACRASDESAKTDVPGFFIASPTAQTPTPAKTPAAQPPKTDAPAETPFDYASLTDPVLIRLDVEPRLQSPIQTLVSTAPQTYTLFFKEAMNRASVEKALRDAQAKDQEERENAVKPTYSFAWASDRQLHVRVEIGDASTLPPFGEFRYMLDVSGAVTQTGVSLNDAPRFRAIAENPGQLWRIRTDGRAREQLTAFDQPYLTMLWQGEAERYLLLSRFQQYCECDADYERIYALYDTETKQMTHYPVELMESYQGNGAFTADTRGFFYAKPEDAAIQLPPSDTAISFQLPDYVYGSGFSKDRAYLFLAVGKEDQNADLDLIVRNLATGEQQRFPQALKGNIIESEVSTSKLPVTFADDGKRVTFVMQDKKAFKELRYQYGWKTRTVQAWNPPVAEDSWSGYTVSDDNLYQLYPNAGLYKGTVKISDEIRDGVWLNGTHRFAFLELDARSSDDAPQTQSLHLYDADANHAQQIAGSLWPDASIVGTSRDGKWIYVRTAQKLPVVLH
ncbi:hypothetical protein EDM56_06735 [Brevibacillus fluminis]|uniref:Lipoprotein n=1 Tax=Brevibacillus fluminis TaxID=511487 RepID=A0A3M8DV74_9BACL|nr:hypothetical protein [Brevibacillus fluminis]RNB91271.1 hypothetical protein EDM56_06735 [Brevibacillus fluminis]